jgi:hypothetical protein
MIRADFGARRSQAASPLTRNLPAANRVSERAERDKNQHLQTLILGEGKIYFYTSDPGAAEMEVKHFKDQ